MCLAVPAKIVSIEKEYAWVELMGLKQKINIQLIDNPAPGDYVLIHAGFAIEKSDSEETEFLLKTLYKSDDK